MKVALEAVETVARFCAIIFLIMSFVVTVFILWLVSFSETVLLSRVSLALSLYSRFGLKVLGVQISGDLTRLQHLKSQNGTLIVSNHLSYLDILVISSIAPTLYVTSVEMRETLGLGFLARIGGCLFVERRSRVAINEEVNELRQALLRGLNVTVFPEATSTPGIEVLPFKNSLFSAVEGLSIPVSPLCLKYTAAGGVELTNDCDLGLRDLVHWYGDMQFVSHLFGLCKLREIRVEARLLEEFNRQPALSRKELASHAYGLISAQYRQLSV